jgi:hypothetical protein
VDGARADHHQQAVVLAVEDAADGLARVWLMSDSTGVPPDREEADQVFGRRQHGDVLDAFVVGPAGAFLRRVPRHRWAAGRLWRSSVFFLGV